MESIPGKLGLLIKGLLTLVLLLILTGPKIHGQVIPASSIPELQPTDPETAQSSDIFLQQLSGKNETVASQPTTPRWIIPLLVIGGVVVCGLFGIILVVIGLVVWQGRRRPKLSTPPIHPPEIPTPARLVVVHGMSDCPLVHIPPEGLMIGRDAKCLLRFNDIQVSRRHARIDFIRGAWLITDLDSANGTFVNRVQVQQKSLSPGDLIQIGELELIFQLG